MKGVVEILSSGTSSSEMSSDRQQALALELGEAVEGWSVYPASVSAAGNKLLALARKGREQALLAVTNAGQFAPMDKLEASHQQIDVEGTKLELGCIAPTHEAAVVLRTLLPWTGPKPVGLSCSAGLGDRLGLATPGHARAVQGTGCVPYFAQQSIREMTRTERTAAEVMDAATWGVLRAGYREGFGSDADHLKTPEDIDTCSAVGFTMYTIDPGDHVCDDADQMSVSALKDALAGLPWSDLESSEADFRKRYVDQTFNLEGGGSLTFNEETLLRGVVKYAGAIAHTARMYRHLQSRRSGKPYELEVSVDETASPTSVAEHYLIAAELKRLGVEWIGMAPRFIGEFEKGIDYKGDLAAFEKAFAQHVAVSRTLGPYKFSIHSGSDKFSIYPIIAKLAGPYVHLKTAGTSYLEALRVVARHDPGLFRRILDFAMTRFDTDRATYHISAQKETVPGSNELADDRLESLLDRNDARQVLHVTFGSVLTDKSGAGEYTFKNDILNVLIDHEEDHDEVLSKHLGRHVAPFAK